MDFLSYLLRFLAIIIVTYGWFLFSKFLVRALDEGPSGPQNDPPVYTSAKYEYDAGITKFDNTFPTYGTDYALGVGSLVAAARIRRRSRELIRGQADSSDMNSRSSKALEKSLARAAQFMFLLYAVSVIAGGFAHQFVQPIISRFFPNIWKICVGSVGLAVIAQGWIGVALYKRAGHRVFKEVRQKSHSDSDLDQILIQSDSRQVSDSVFARQVSDGCADSLAAVNNALKQSPLIRAGIWLLQTRSSNPARAVLVNRTTWAIHGFIAAVLIYYGAFSFHRPAADIFAVGTLQSLASIFLVLGGLADCAAREVCEAAEAEGQDARKLPIGNGIRAWKKLALAFALNSPLIVLYPWLVWTGWKLGTVNAILHCWLALAWGSQWWVIEREIL